MSFVTLIGEEQVDPSLKQTFQEIRQHFGLLPNYYQAIGRIPSVVEGHQLLGSDLMQDGALPKVVKEQIGLVVSGINSSSYCVAFHMEVLRNLGIEKSLGRKLATDPQNAPVPDNVKALFRYAEKLTRKPADITKADADAVLAAGWSEAALLELAVTVAMFNLYNRVSLGLGLMADF